MQESSLDLTEAARDNGLRMILRLLTLVKVLLSEDYERTRYSRSLRDSLSSSMSSIGSSYCLKFRSLCVIGGLLERIAEFSTLAGDY